MVRTPRALLLKSFAAELLLLGRRPRIKRGERARPAFVIQTEMCSSSPPERGKTLLPDHGLVLIPPGGLDHTAQAVSRVVSARRRRDERLS
jgi:hypothetical protein